MVTARYLQIFANLFSYPSWITLSQADFDPSGAVNATQGICMVLADATQRYRLISWQGARNE
jgi:hypothetical protein